MGPWVSPLDWEGKGVADIVGNLVWFVLVCPWAMGPWVAPWGKRKNPSACRSRCQNTSSRSGHQRWETFLSRTHTQLRLASPARSHARHEHEAKTDFPIGGQLRRLIPLQSPTYIVLGFQKYEGLKICRTRMLDLLFKRSETSIVFGPKFPK